MPLIRQPLLRLLAINLAIGVSMAVLMVGGLLALNPLNLRHLIFADRDAAAALGLLLFGFLITFGSAAMGTAVMALGAPRESRRRRWQIRQGPDRSGRARPQAARVTRAQAWRHRLFNSKILNLFRPRGD